ncbi:MAG: thymidine phosphorylase, partial [Mycoplasmataceae bacterium]|nr:thymidine phosphorylase [Mycoplasmataceae bacterium]
MNILSIIEKKSNNQELTKEEIYFWVNGYTKQEIPDYQIAALLMAIKINGMTDDETYYLTKSYVDSGSTIEFDDVFVVDKHSTGGIGDKTSIILAPLMASLGINVGKLSGRGLGFTGGTIDKLESIKGFSTSLTQEEFVRNVTEKGISIIGQIDTLAPADKYIYALRDSTVTSNSLPLICASILSKKFAVSADLIMIDIKCGTGAFMKDLKSAERLAKLMIRIAKKFDRKLSCIITDMSAPLGQQI